MYAVVFWLCENKQKYGAMVYSTLYRRGIGLDRVQLIRIISQPSIQ